MIYCVKVIPNTQRRIGNLMESIEIKKSIDISASGGNCHIRLGDIDGDGRLEIVMIKPSVTADERYFSRQIASATAYNVSGELMWQIGDPAIESDPYSGDLPAQIYDIDNDGKNEFIFIINNELCIADGKTSEIKKKVSLPSEYACDCIVIADLEGTGYPQNIIIKNKYSQMWAYDVNLNIIWTFSGNIGNTPVAYDINGDGKDEILAGYNVISSNGELLWKADMTGSANSVFADDIYENGETVVIICGPKVKVYTSAGELLWELERPASKITCGKFRSGVPGKDLLLFDDLSLFDTQGEFQFKKNETIYLPTLVHNFDSTGRTYIAGHKKEDVVTTVYDGDMRSIYTLPTFGNIASGDLLGDGISQILIYNDENLDIYSFAETDYTEANRGFSRPQTKQYYNVSCHNALPISQYVTSSANDDYTTQSQLDWADTYANLNMYNSFSKVSRGEFIQILASLLNLKEEFSDNFADVARDDNYYDSIGTFRALGILSSEDNMFMPQDTITVAFANEILEKLSIPLQFKFDEKYELSKQDAAKLIISLREPN